MAYEVRISDWSSECALPISFRMGADFVPTPGADGWQLSNPPILGLAPLRGSLELFDRAGMAALRGKSERLTGYLETLIRERLSDTLQIATPREPERRGAQLSLRVVAVRGLTGRDAGRSLFDRSEERRVGTECVRTCRARGSPSH